VNMNCQPLVKLEWATELCAGLSWKPFGHVTGAISWGEAWPSGQRDEHVLACGRSQVQDPAVAVDFPF
jgi:hypothetical protein